MSEVAFYTRVRGKISGPFDISTLQKLVRRGTLSRIHEISSDRASWSAAGEYEDLFPTPQVALPSQSAALSGPPEAIDMDPPVTSDAAESIGAASGPYYYVQRGSTVGPVPLAVLKVLVENGTLQSGDLVWREHAEAGTQAAYLPALAPLFVANGRGDGSTLCRGSPREDARLHQALAATSAQARLTGIGAGAGLLILLNLPWVVVQGKPVWWWDAYQTPQGGPVGTFFAFMVVAAMTLCIVTPLVPGVSRAIVFLCLMAATWLFASIVLSMNQAPVDVLLVWAVPATMAIALGACAFRPAAPGHIGAKILQGIACGVVVLGMMLGLINSFRNTGSFEGVPGSLVFSGMLAFIGMLAGLAGGIMGLIGLKPQFSGGLNVATIVNLLAALFLPGLAIFFAVAGADGLTPGGFGSMVDHALSGVVLEITARVLLCAYACLAVLAVGIRELLMSIHVRTAAT